MLKIREVFFTILFNPNHDDILIVRATTFLVFYYLNQKKHQCYGYPGILVMFQWKLLILQPFFNHGLFFLSICGSQSHYICIVTVSVIDFVFCRLRVNWNSSLPLSCVFSLPLLIIYTVSTLWIMDYFTDPYSFTWTLSKWYLRITLVVWNFYWKRGKNLIFCTWCSKSALREGKTKFIKYFLQGALEG